MTGSNLFALSITDLGVSENQALHWTTGGIVSLYLQQHHGFSPIEAFLAVAAISLIKEGIDYKQGLGFDSKDPMDWIIGAVAVNFRFQF